MDQEAELAARLAVINELDAAVRASRAAGTTGVSAPGRGFGRLLGRLIRRG